MYRNQSFLQKVFYTKRKNPILFYIGNIYIFIYFKYLDLSWEMKMELCIYEKFKNSIGTKMSANLLNNREQPKYFLCMIQFNE